MKLGAELATIHDDGRIPWASMSSPVDDEGVPQRRRTLLDHGAVSTILYDSLHAGAFETQSTGSGLRGLSSSFRSWYRFLKQPDVSVSTVALDPGTGGTDAELVESAGEGIWVQQIGWSSPDPLTGAFGGEIRLGYRIRHGKLAESIRGGTVGGIALAPEGSPSLMTRLEALGSKASLSESVFSPPVLVRPLVVKKMGIGDLRRTSLEAGKGGSCGTSGTVGLEGSRSRSRRIPSLREPRGPSGGIGRWRPDATRRDPEPFEVATKPASSAPPQTAHFESDIPLTGGRPRGSGISLLRLLRK